MRDYALFVSFFPQLIAGPIVHHSHTRPQYARIAKSKLNLELLPYGLMIFAMGLFKKTIIADPIARLIDPIFAAANLGEPLSALMAWTAMIGYTLQIYFDFSGYCDMAIGLGLMFGSPPADQFQLALQIKVHHRVLAALAHYAVKLFAGLCLHSTRRQPPWRAFPSAQYLPDHADRRYLAWRRLDVRHLGRNPCRIDYSEPRFAPVGANIRSME